MSPTIVVGLRAARYTDSPFVASPRPALSWWTETSAAGWRQIRAEIRITRANGAVVSVVEGDRSVGIVWPTDPIGVREELQVEVRVTGADHQTTPWSEPLQLMGGYLAPGEWVADRIGWDGAGDAHPALLRGTFRVAEGLRRATLYATAHGTYQILVNGAPVDDQLLKPGWTSYQWRLTHETTDVTGLLRLGDNVLGIDLAGGWWTESYGFRDSARRFYGNRPDAAAQLVLDYEDGTSQTFATDSSWRATGAGPRTASGTYTGEEYDARLEQPGWSAPGFDDSAWTQVRIEDGGPIPRARTVPAVRALQEITVVDTITTPSGATVLDFGQNLVGRLRLRVSGPRGEVITLRHAEVLENGELATRPLRAAAATDRYTLAGNAEETWEPAFTFHGFRFAEVAGWPGDVDPSAITAIVIHSDMERTGWFESSHRQLNRLHDNVVWSMRGNFLSVPTDCPQRDERLGWTGDIQVFAPTASFLYDCDAFLAGWLEDVALEQAHQAGVVPFVVPNVLGPALPAAAWGDATCVVPLVLYERFGDLEVVRAQFDSMRAWSDVLIERAGDRLLWEDDFQFGDWLDPDAPPDRPADAKADTELVATAHLFRSVQLTAEAARLLGEMELFRHYSEIAGRIRSAFLNEYVTESGRMVSDAATAYCLAIVFGLTRDPQQSQAMGDRLGHLVRRSGFRISTGFVGTPIIADALTLTGHADVAGRLLLQTENPSWLYPVTMGATTIWERWDSMLEDGTINPGEMTSFNHYALGAVADWLHRTVAGLAPAEPGYRRIRIAPIPLVGLEWASATHRTPYGTARVSWRRSGEYIQVDAVVPPNTRADVILPDGTDQLEVGSGSHSWTVKQTPDAAPAVKVLSLDSAVCDIIDDPAAYETLWRTIAATSPTQAADFRQRTDWASHRRLGDSIDFTFGVQKADIQQALDRLNTDRT